MCCGRRSSRNKCALGDCGSGADGSDTPERLLEGSVDHQTVSQASVVELRAKAQVLGNKTELIKYETNIYFSTMASLLTVVLR